MTDPNSPDGVDAEQAYARRLEEAFLGLRGAGLILSSADMVLIQEWYSLGLPLEQVVAGMILGAEKVQSQRRPLRRLGQLKTAVLKNCRVAPAGRRGDAGNSVAATPAGRYDVEQPFIEQQQEETLALLEDASATGHFMASALSWLSEGLERLTSLGPDTPTRVPELLALSRQFYERVLDAMPADALASLDEILRESLRNYEPTTDEAVWTGLRVAHLRQQVALLMPTALMALLVEDAS